MPVPIRVDGEERLTYWDASILPYLDAEGAFDGWLVTAMEVSDRVEKERLEATLNAGGGVAEVAMKEGHKQAEEMRARLESELARQHGEMSKLIEDLRGELQRKSSEEDDLRRQLQQEVASCENMRQELAARQAAWEEESRRREEAAKKKNDDQAPQA